MKNFKKVIFALMVVFLVVGFIGCKTETDPKDPPAPENNFKGKTFLGMTGEGEDAYFASYIIFTSDKDCEVMFFDEEPMPATYTVADDVATLKGTGEYAALQLSTTKLTDGKFSITIPTTVSGEEENIVVSYAVGTLWTILYDIPDSDEDFSLKMPEEELEFAVEHFGFVEADYNKDDATKTVTLTASGWAKVQAAMGGGSEEEGGEITSETWTVLDPAGDFLESFESLEAANEYATQTGLVLDVDYTMDFDAQIIRLTYAGLDKLYGEESTIYYTFYNGHELDRTFSDLEEFKSYASVVVEPALIEGTDYTIDEENRRIILTDSGFEKMQGRTLVVKYNDVEIDYEFYSWKELEIFATEHNLIEETDYIIDDVNWVITLTDAGAEKLGIGGGSGEEGGEVTGETWTVMYGGITVETFESLEAAGAFASNIGLEENVDYTVNNETQTITLTAAGAEKVGIGGDTDGGDSGEVYYYKHNGELIGGKNTLEDFLYEVELYDLVEGTDYTIDHENKYINFTYSGYAKLGQ